MKDLLFGLLAVLVASCNRGNEDRLLFAAEPAIARSGLADALRDEYQAKNQQRVELWVAPAPEIADRMAKGEVQVALLFSRRPIPSGGCFAGQEVWRAPIAHEEVVLFGPPHAQVRVAPEGKGDTAWMINDLARSSQLLFIPPKGSIERELYDLEVAKIRTREPGNFIESKLDGVDRVQATLDQKGVTLILRSALAMAYSDEKLKGQVYLSNRPELRVDIDAIATPENCTKKPRPSDLMLFLRGDRAESVMAKVGKKLGFAVYERPSEPVPEEKTN